MLLYKAYNEVLFNYNRNPPKKTNFVSRLLLSLKGSIWFN